MRYELYTLPNCEKCRKAKEILSDMNGEVLSLAEPDGLRRFRSYMPKIRGRLKRDANMSYVLPITLFLDGEEIKVVQGLEGLVECASKL